MPSGWPSLVGSYGKDHMIMAWVSKREEDG
jgi:hypothetical protein